MQIVFECSADVRGSIDSIGRTEDIMFSPDGRRLAIAGYDKHLVLILDVAIDNTKGVVFDRSLVLRSSAFCHPHGVSWIDGETIAVANRDGLVPVIRIPTANALETIVHPAALIGSSVMDGIQTPGSLTIRAVDEDFCEIFVCNNYANTVTRHLVNITGGMAVLHSDVAYRDCLKVPDSIAISSSGEWIAVSNHYENAVFIYRQGGGDRPIGYLEGIGFPHGLRFLPGNDNAILVADAGAPFVHLFKTNDGSWAGTRLPVSVVEVMDKATFDRGHTNPEEGGPKGIALSPDGKLLFVTCEFEPLVIFDIEDILAEAEIPLPSVATPRSLDATDVLADALSGARSSLGAASASVATLTERAAEAERRAAAAELQVEQLTRSRSWKLTRPLRALTRLLDRGR